MFFKEDMQTPHGAETEGTLAESYRLLRQADRQRVSEVKSQGAPLASCLNSELLDTAA